MSRSLTARALGVGRRLADTITLAGARGRPVFVGACPRSGTTMLRTMLNTHPDLAIPRETRFLLEMYEHRYRYGDLRRPANKQAAAEFIVLRSDSWFDRFGVDQDLAMQRMLGAPPTMGSLIGMAFKLYAEVQGKQRWGDKRPSYVLHLPGIFDMFPDAQFVNVVRDPRGAVASMKKLGWYDGSVAEATELWLRCVRHGRRASRRFRDDQFFEISYEKLVNAPEDSLLSMCRFLDLDTAHVGRMLGFHENVDEPTSRYHHRLQEPVNPATVDTWQNVLSSEEVALVEAKCGPLMREYGYEPRAGTVAIPEALSLAFDARKAKMRKREVKLEKMRRREPYPLTARLTTSQRRRFVLDRVGVRVRSLVS